MADSGLARFKGSPNVNYGCCESDMKDIQFGYMWTIKKFSCMHHEPGEFLLSSLFSEKGLDKHKWCLKLYPRGKEQDDQAYVSLFLRHRSSIELRATVEFAIVANSGEKDVKKTVLRNFTINESDWGFSRYIERDKLMNENNGLLNNDQVSICCEITVEKLKTTKMHYRPNSIVSFEDMHLGCSQLTDDLGRLLNSQHFCDVVLVADNNDLPAHKAILAARSPVFAAMFRHDLEENRENRVVIADIAYSTLEALIRFIYTGKLATTDDQMAIELLYAADKYGLEDLKALCDKGLSAKLTAENVVQLIPLASLHNCTHLKAQLILFMKTHTTDDAVSQLWSLLISQHPQQVAGAFKASFEN